MPPGGVASRFVAILAHDARAARSRLSLGIALAVLFTLPAGFLSSPPWQGLLLHAGAALAGAGLGALLARGQSKRFEASIRTTWSQWMRFAMAAESVAEIHRKVRGRAGRNLPYLYGAGLFVAWALEAAALVLAFVQPGPAPLGLASPAILLNGLVAGALVGHAAVLGGWLRELRGSVTEMVDAGEIGVWGVL